MGEQELARAILHYVLLHFGVPPERARMLVDDLPSIELETRAARR